MDCIDLNDGLRKKAIMEETFVINQKKPTDPDFQYDIEKDFDHGQIESSKWDSEDNDSGF